MEMKKQKGVTMIALVMTVTILLALTSITINIGSELIDETNLEDLKTDMLLIQAKAKEYVEQARFKNSNDELIGKPIDASTIDNKYVEQVEIENGLYYSLSKEDLSTLGLNKIEMTNENYYIIVYDIENLKVDVLNSMGYTDQEANTYYSLSKLESI